MITIKLAKRFLTEYKICVTIVMLLVVLWKFGFFANFENDWKQFLFETKHSEVKNNERWMNSPLWVEDQKPHINPHKFRYYIEKLNFDIQWLYVI